MKRILAAFGVLALSWTTPSAARDAQEPCRPPAPSPSTQPNIFSEEQENDLGDAVAEQIERDIRVIDDAALSAELRRIGARLVSHLPPTRLRIQFFLVDLSDANAFVLPGGRIYVSRKLVRFSQSEDELAGVLGHELGHLVLRQQTIMFSRWFKDALNVTQLGDRRDVFDKYNALMDSVARRPGVFRQSDAHEDREQVAADRLGLFVVAAAGYDPQAHTRLLDRLLETKGKTGNFFSNLFGTTSPDAKRLREMIRTATALPAACVQAGGGPTADAYARWQAAVVSYVGLGRTEALHGVLSKTALAPPLRGDLHHVRFSPDGRHLLAQDDAGISVLTRDPLAPRFRIEAPEATPARFTPDSQHVVFHTSDLRIERWTVADGRLAGAHELYVKDGCWQTALSPDGGTLACLDTNFDLALFAVASGTAVFRKKAFYTPDPFTLLEKVFSRVFTASDDGDRRVEFLNLGFSSDGRFFAASFRSRGMPELEIGRDDDSLVYDFKSSAVVPLKGGVRNLMTGGFVFTGPDQLIAFNADNANKSAVVALPSGEVTKQLGMFAGSLEAATKGDYLFVRPFQKYGVGVMDVAKGQIVKGSPTVAIDIHGDVFIAERATGELGLYSVADNQLRAAVTLPSNTLGRLRAAAISDDLRYVAMSERSRGAVWDLSSGARVAFLRGFRGGFFDTDGSLFADFPKLNEEPRKMMRLDLRQRQMQSLAEIKDKNVEQSGAFLLVTRPVMKGGQEREGVTLEMQDARDARVLWTKTFTKDSPVSWVEPVQGTAVLVWPAAAPTVRDEARKDPVLSKRLSALKEKEGDYFLQVLDARTGAVRGAVFLETGKGSFRLDEVFAVNDWVVVADSENRVLVYSLASGEQTGRVFGSRATVGAAARVLCVENGPGRVALYDLDTMKRRDDFTFTHAVSLTSFSSDGKKLLVVTADQTAYVLNIGSASR